MSLSLLKQPDRRYRRKGSRIAGKIWLAIIFIVLTAMHLTGIFVLPYIGKYAQSYEATLFVAIIWHTVLTAAIWNKQGWARIALAIFLFCFVALQLVFIPDVIVRYPEFREEGLQIVLLLTASDILAALFLLVSSDIRWISHPSID